MIVITGWRSQITKEFLRLLPAEEAAMQFGPMGGSIPRAPRYLFCQGLLRPKRSYEQTFAELEESYTVNCASIVWACTKILADNPVARICIIGSESAYRGSFDGAYAAAKADLHAFIERAPVRGEQQIVGISPSIIHDAGMTLRREDTENLVRRQAEHPKGRFLASKEVAELAYFCLYGASDYLTNHVIRLHGGLQ